jgi:hypothetical protein
LRKLHLLLLPALMLALGFGLTACGGGGDSDEDAIVETIETSATSTDPADCKKLATLKFLEQTQFQEGPAAVESCEEQAPETADNPDSVEVSEVEIDGSKAGAEVAFEGGNFDGQTFSSVLVEEGGTWKMDKLTGFVEFDQEQLASSLEDEFTRGEDALPAAVAACAGQAFRDLPAPEFEDLILGGDLQPLVEIVEGCQSQQ